jgi:predicted nucleic-acid-binding protein
MSSTPGSLDANILLRLLLNDIPDHHQAVLKLFRNASGQFAVADTAIIEIAFVLCGKDYAFTREQAAEAIDGLMNLKEVNCNRMLFDKALPQFVAHLKLSFEDCCLSVYATLGDAEPLWTFDRKLASQAPSAKLMSL